jgi:hypothetical protein
VFLPLGLHAQDPAAVAPNSTPASPPLGVEDKLKLHVKRMIQPTVFLKSAASAGLQQLRDSPPEWEQGAEGYGRRYASSYGFNGFKNIVQFGLDSTLREDPRYFATGKKGFASRAFYAALQAVYCYTDSGRRRFAFARVGSAYSAGFISGLWEPDRVATAPKALLRGSQSVGIDAGTNVFKEFWPDIKKKLRRK